MSNAIITIESLTRLRNNLEAEIEVRDASIVVGCLMGGDWRSEIPELLALKEAHAACLRQLGMYFSRQDHSDAPYGMVLPRHP